MRFAIFLLAGLSFAQVNSGIRYVSTTPSGSCSANSQLRLKTPGGALYSCQSGIWASLGGGSSGSGTVNSGTIGQLGYYTATGTAISATGSGAFFNPTALATPAAPTVNQTAAGTPGVVGYTYVAVAVNSVGHTVESADGSTATGNATLNNTNWNNVVTSCTGLAAGTLVDVYRTVSGGTPATTGKITTSPVACGSTVQDKGLAGDGVDPSNFTNSTQGLYIANVARFPGQVVFGTAVPGGLEPASLVGGGAEWIMGLSGTLTSSEGTGLSISTTFDPSAGALFDNAVLIEAKTLSTNSQDIDFAGAINAGIYHYGSGILGPGGAGYTYGNSGFLENRGAGFINNARAGYNSLVSAGTGGFTGKSTATWSELLIGSGITGDIILSYNHVHKSGGTIGGTLTALYTDDLAGLTTNAYYSWDDSRGVRRSKEDNTFDSVGQSIEALYNPQFTKYTPGAADYERVVLGQWNGNVAEIGTEKGGTGTLRVLRFIGASVELPGTSFAFNGKTCTIVAGAIACT